MIDNILKKKHAIGNPGVHNKNTISLRGLQALAKASLLFLWDEADTYIP